MNLKAVIKKKFYGTFKLDTEDTPINSFGLNNQKNRDNWLQKNLLNIPSGKRILDAGAGELQYKKFCTHLKYISQDFGQYNGMGNNLGLQMETWDNTKLDIISDISDIPEPDNSFDAIMCIEVFEHLPEPLEALREFSRLLKTGGTLILTAPFCSLTHFAPFHFYSGFNKFFYEKHLPNFDFQIEEIVPNGNYFSFLAQEIQFRIPNSYTNYSISKSEASLIQKMLNLLEHMNSSDNNSSDLLCFGYQIRALKIDHC